ncbi:hypothetical protein [Clostridium sardiniense]|uniref:hypothetical protein n=1 Tax=Clostridium sardiniense TaxID=29369 RepID=UPI001957FC6F|nr:hypothetical protein [Clostridium sardiniense]MBM7836485.1 ribosomal protein S17E [Clostridium sardiniense]
METDLLNYIIDNSISNKEVFERYSNLIQELSNIEKLNHKNITNEIKTVIMQQCENHLNEIKDYYDEFKYDFNNNKYNFILLMKETLKIYCNKEDICYICGDDLEYSMYKESRGEYFGFPSYENIYKAHCSNGCF